MWLGVGHDVDGFLRWVERDLLHFTPLVQLGLTLLGFSLDGDDAGIVCELSMDDFHETCLVDSTLGVLVEKVPEEHPVQSLAFHDHLSGSLLQPGPRQLDHLDLSCRRTDLLQRQLCD